MADPEISKAAAHIILYVILKAFPQLDFNSWKAPVVFSDYAAHFYRNHSRYNDLTALTVGELANASHAEPQVVQHAFGHRYEFATGRRERHLSRAAQK